MSTDICDNLNKQRNWKSKQLLTLVEKEAGGHSESDILEYDVNRLAARQVHQLGVAADHLRFGVSSGQQSCLSVETGGHLGSGTFDLLALFTTRCHWAHLTILSHCKRGLILLRGLSLSPLDPRVNNLILIILRDGLRIFFLYLLICKHYWYDNIKFRI